MIGINLPEQIPIADNEKTLIFFVKRNGAPERIRTSDPQIRSLVLYPAELRVLA